MIQELKIKQIWLCDNVYIDSSWSQQRIDEEIDYRHALDRANQIYHIHNAITSSECGNDKDELLMLLDKIDKHDLKYDRC